VLSVSLPRGNSIRGKKSKYFLAFLFFSFLSLVHSAYVYVLVVHLLLYREQTCTYVHTCSCWTPRLTVTSETSLLLRAIAISPVDSDEDDSEFTTVTGNDIQDNIAGTTVVVALALVTGIL
jgi:hypothetical protein